jgi:hypothetical protein
VVVDGWVGFCVCGGFFLCGFSLSLVFVRTWIFLFSDSYDTSSLFSQWQFVHDSMLVSLILPHV